LPGSSVSMATPLSPTPSSSHAPGPVRHVSDVGSIQENPMFEKRRSLLNALLNAPGWSDRCCPAENRRGMPIAMVNNREFPDIPTRSPTEAGRAAMRAANPDKTTYSRLDFYGDHGHKQTHRQRHTCPSDAQTGKALFPIPPPRQTVGGGGRTGPFHRSAPFRTAVGPNAKRPLRQRAFQSSDVRRCLLSGGCRDARSVSCNAALLCP
jgi:hypothetical protein